MGRNLVVACGHSTWDLVVFRTHISGVRVARSTPVWRSDSSHDDLYTIISGGLMVRPELVPLFYHFFVFIKFSSSMSLHTCPPVQSTKPGAARASGLCDMMSERTERGQSKDKGEPDMFIFFSRDGNTQCLI